MKPMFTDLKARVHSFLAKHCSDRKDEMQLMVYLTYQVLVILGMPMHFAFGFIGQEDFCLKAISIGIWLTAVVVFILFLSKRLRLPKAFFWLAVPFQFFECVRIVYLAAMTSPAWLIAHQKLVVINELLSYCNLVGVCVALVPLAPTLILGMYLVSIGVAYVICPSVMVNQFVLLTSYYMVGIWVYFLITRRLVSSTARDMKGYKQFQDSVLDMFHMGKAELVSIIQLCRGAGRRDEMYGKMLANLSEQTCYNLIAIGAYLQNERRDQATDLAAEFPQLTPSELEVVRLILKDMTLKEIAVATGKSLSNVGTVRGNIRKKLGLSPEDNLRDWLLAELKSKTGSRFPMSNLLFRGGVNDGGEVRLDRAAGT